MALFNWFTSSKKKDDLEEELTVVGDVSREIMISVMEDTVEERNRALRLAAENQQLAAIVQQSEEGIVQLDPDGKVVTINNSAKTFFAIDISGDSNIYFTELFDEADQAAVKHTLAKVLNKEVVSPITLHKKSNGPGSLIVLELKFSALFDNNQTIFSIVVVIRDISQLHRQQEELRLLIEQAPNALIMADKNGQIVTTNAQAEKLFGYGSDDLVGQSVEILVPDAIRHNHPELRAKFLNAPKARAMGAGRDLTARRKDGSEVAVEIGLSPLKTRSGNFVIASIVDITERIRSQQTLESINRQLQQKNQEMEQFIYTVSHDLKSPLVTIAGFSNMLHESLNTNITEKQSHHINRIFANIEHMESLLNDLLELSQVIHQEIQIEPVDLGTMVASVNERLEGIIDKNAAKIHFKNPGVAIHCNQKLMELCLQNLIANAIQYRHPTRTPEINLSFRQTDAKQTLRVKDNGIGIEEKYFEQIFRIFERLNIGEGTGVGLAIVKTVVEKHSGTISLESTPGIGSTFSIHLPRP